MRILVCDDHVLLAVALAARLRADGHEAHVVVTPEDAVAAAGRLHFDLCLLDLRFPGRPWGGLDVIPDLRRVAPSTALLLVSGALTPEVARLAVERGADGVAGKDISLVELERAVRDVVAGRVVAPEELLRRPGRKALTRRERQVLDLVTDGRSTSEVGATLGIAVSTVRGHLQAAMAKLDVHSRIGAATLAGRPDAQRALEASG